MITAKEHEAYIQGLNDAENNVIRILKQTMTTTGYEEGFANPELEVVRKELLDHLFKMAVTQDENTSEDVYELIESVLKNESPRIILEDKKMENYLDALSIPIKWVYTFVDNPKSNISSHAKKAINQSLKLLTIREGGLK